MPDGFGWSVPCPDRFAPGQGALLAYSFYRRLGGPLGQTERDRVREKSVGFHEKNVLNLRQVRGYAETLPDFPVPLQATALV